MSPAATLARRTMRPRRTAVTAPNYKESTVNFHDAGGWKVASPQDAMLRGNWWEVFNDPELNALEEQLNINNQNLKVYFQNYMAARATIAEARAQYWPAIRRCLPVALRSSCMLGERGRGRGSGKKRIEHMA